MILAQTVIILLLLAEANAAPHVEWYQDSSVRAAAATGLFIIIVTVLKSWLDGRSAARTKKAQQEVDGTAQHISLINEKENLTKAERAELLKELKELHEAEVDSWKQRFLEKAVSDFESRQINHIVLGELSRLHAHLFDLKNGTAHNDFKLKYYAELVAGLDTQILEKRKQIAERYNIDIDK